MKYTRRKDFKFYRSYFDVLNELESEADQLAFLKALINKQFLGEDPELSGMAKFAYISQQHAIEQQCKGWEQKAGYTLNSPENRGTQGGTQGGGIPPTGGGGIGVRIGSVAPLPDNIQLTTNNKQHTTNNIVKKTEAEKVLLELFETEKMWLDTLFRHTKLDEVFLPKLANKFQEAQILHKTSDGWLNKTKLKTHFVSWLNKVKPMPEYSRYFK